VEGSVKEAMRAHMPTGNSALNRIRPRDEIQEMVQAQTFQYLSVLAQIGDSAVLRSSTSTSGGLD
jgi:hypothetical protein